MMLELATLEARPRTRVIVQYARAGQDVSVDKEAWIGHQMLIYGIIDAEACQLVFDPQKLSYRDILEYFYKMHDPTTSNRQGPDTGSQYRSGIFYHSDEQKAIAEEITKKANEQWWKNGIVTEILPVGEWWDAEKYHQLYLDNNPGGYECPSHFVRKLPPLK